MRHADPRFAGNLFYALLVIAICATGIGAAASVLDVHVADVVATALRPIA